jgi:hypothetical protein
MVWVCSSVPPFSKLRRNASSSEHAAAGGVGQPSFLRTPLDHLKDVEPAHCIASELVALVYAPKQRLFLFRPYSGRSDPTSRSTSNWMASGTFVPLCRLPRVA